jgi:hypothetical protein
MLARSATRVLEWGWHTPRLQDIPQYIDVAQTLPFDGLILDMATPDNSNGLSWTLFGDQRVDQSLLSGLENELTDLKWGRLTDNFLQVNVAPANVDWFDDFDAILYNFESIAGLAKRLGFKGIMLDTEQYGECGPLSINDSAITINTAMSNTTPRFICAVNRSCGRLIAVIRD